MNSVLGSVLALLLMTPGFASGESRAGVVPGPLASRSLPGLRADVATMMMQGATSGAIDLAVAPGLRSSGDAVTLELTVEVAGESLLASEAEDGVPTVDVEIYAYAVDGEGAVVAHLARIVAISIDDWGERLASGGLRFYAELGVPSEAFSLRTLVLIPALGRYGMMVSQVPGAISGLGRPRFHDACGEWLAVTTGGSAPLSQASARPVWTTGEQIELRVPARGAPASGAESALLTFGSVSGGSTSLPLPVESRGKPEAGELLVFSFEVPDLKQGAYEVSVGLGEEAPITSPAIDVWIVSRPPGAPRDDGSPSPGRRVPSAETAGPGDSAPCAWPGVRSGARLELAEVAPVRAQGAVGGGSARRKLTRGYVGVLRSLGRGQDLEATVQQLVEWERARTHEDARGNILLVKAAQVDVLRTLAEVDREALVPIFELHRRAYREHFKRRQFGLAGHSRVLATAVVEMWLATLANGEEPGWAADGLVTLGQTADRHRMFAASQGLLERATDIAPHNRSARLLLSMLYEKLGQYEPARHHLAALLEVAPADAEAWLRLATLERRLGEPERSMAALRRVIGQRPEPWILSLAYQTLVQELFGRESFTAGLRALDEAELLLPGDPALGLARAYGLDRVGRAREAAEALDRVAPTSPEVVSSRLRYVDSGADIGGRAAVSVCRGLVVRQLRLGRALTTAFGEPA